MPKKPILSRTLLYDTLQSRGADRRTLTFFYLDWTLVQTSLGAMLEARPIIRTGFAANEDPYDTDYNDRRPVTRAQLYPTFNSGGDLMPRDWNTSGNVL